MTASGWRVARIGVLLGCAIAALLLARLIQVQTQPGRAGLAFALIYGSLLGLPFVAALAARRLRAGPRGGVWLLAGLSVVILALLSVSVAALPLVIPALLLVAGGLMAITSEARE